MHLLFASPSVKLTNPCREESIESSNGAGITRMTNTPMFQFAKLKLGRNQAGLSKLPFLCWLQGRQCCDRYSRFLTIVCLSRDKLVDIKDLDLF